MGPTNIALVKLYNAERALRDATERLDSASRSVRVQERRIAELTEKQRLAQSELRELQARVGELELDIKAREGKIDKYRQQQQQSINLKEYQTFLTEINTEKIDKSKVEDEAFKVMEQVEKKQAEIADLTTQLQVENEKHAQTREKLGGKLAELQAEVDRLVPLRAEAVKSVPPRALDMFERLCDKLEGEAMAAMSKPHRRREEYNCGACHMDLVVDIYNRLHTRDEPVVCPNCHRLLYIPEDLTPDVAIHSKPKKAAAAESQE
jgi:predicted  nucleic acid-binding Zn-ribbon protein